jgi:response regulator of citrate/malate metabolism
MRIDLLLVDIHLPGAQDGLDLARHVHTRGMPTRMILTSGVSEASAIPDLDDLGLFIRKPYLISRVISLVSHSLNWPDTPTM